MPAPVNVVPGVDAIVCKQWTFPRGRMREVSQKCAVLRTKRAETFLLDRVHSVRVDGASYLAFEEGSWAVDIENSSTCGVKFEFPPWPVRRPGYVVARSHKALDCGGREVTPKLPEEDLSAFMVPELGEGEISNVHRMRCEYATPEHLARRGVRVMRCVFDDGRGNTETVEGIRWLYAGRLASLSFEWPREAAPAVIAPSPEIELTFESPATCLFMRESRLKYGWMVVCRTSFDEEQGFRMKEVRRKMEEGSRMIARRARGGIRW